MTNSTPKNNNRIERQGSPSHYQQSGKKSGGRSPNHIKTVTYFANGHNPSIAALASATPNNGGRNNNNNGKSPAARQNCSSPNSCTPARNISRASPMRNETPRGSPTNSFYAGAKFSEPPSPASVPKPPSHWTGPTVASHFTGCDADLLTQHLRMLINVQA